MPSTMYQAQHAPALGHAQAQHSQAQNGQQTQAEHRILQNYQQPVLPTGFSVNSNFAASSNYPNTLMNNNKAYDNYQFLNSNNLGGNAAGGYYDYGLFNYNDNINRQGLGMLQYDDYSLAGGSNSNFPAKSPCAKGGANPILLFIIMAAAGVGFYFVYQKYEALAAAGGNGRTMDSPTEYFDYILAGLEDFENKIDKLASGGVDDDEHSWISTIYNEFNGNGAENDVDEDFNEIEGLEPPMLDETWGLKDSNSVDENATKPIPKKKLQDQEFAKFAEETFKQPGTCQAKIWRCATRVAEGGLEYLDKPEGITGVLKNYLFKIGFQGALGKFWNAVLSIPEARKLKICMAANDKCKALEILQNEVQSEDGTTGGDSSINNRLFVNPDFVQDLDQSDGSKQFDNENEEEFGDA